MQGFFIQNSIQIFVLIQNIRKPKKPHYLYHV